MAVTSFGRSMDSISLNPVRLFVLGSFIQISHVYLMSALVNGVASDHLMPGLSSHVTSSFLPSALTLAPPLATVGTLLAKFGMYSPSVVVEVSASMTPKLTTSVTAGLA